MYERKESGKQKCRKKKLLSLLLAMVLIVTSFPLTANAATKVIVKTTRKMGVGKSITKTVPSKITGVRSSKSAVATVKKISSKTYKITGKKAGTATIDVKYNKTMLKVFLKVGATSIKNGNIPTSMEAGTTGTYKVSPNNATGDKFVWKSSDSDVIKVGGFTGRANIISALKTGSASIQVTSKNTGVRLTVKITVVEKDKKEEPMDTASPTVEPQVTETASPITAEPQITATPQETWVPPTPTVNVTATPKPTETVTMPAIATPKITVTPTVKPFVTTSPIPVTTVPITPTPTVKLTPTPTANVTSTPVLPTLTPDSNSPFAGGNGTAESPYQIRTLDQLQKVSDYKECYFVQVSDIDVDYGAFEPFSTETDPFTGQYDGGGYSILNYNYADGDKEQASIFGWIGKEGTVKNVTIKDSFLTAQTGAVLAYVNDGNILSCKVEDTSASLKKKSTALICAYNRGTMRDCSAEGTITYITGTDGNYQAVGGVVGVNTGAVYNCIATCNIKVAGHVYLYAGGVVGANYSIMKNCQSGSVISVRGIYFYSGNHYAGGVVGLNDGQVIQCTYLKTIDDITVDEGENKGLIAGGGDGIVT